MNKRADSLKKNLEKRVLHTILPKLAWRKFDSWRVKMGFATTIEGVRHLIRTGVNNGR